MNTAESVMETSPDSALALLSGIDNKSLTDREERARHALLLTMATNKNHIPISQDSTIRIAYDYYKAKDDRRNLMLSALYAAKAYYCMDDTTAVIAFAKEAYDLSKKLKNDTILGRSAEMLELEYGFCSDHVEALRYCKEAIEGYHRANLIDNECFILLDYAGLLIEKKQFDEALSLIESIKEMKLSSKYSTMIIRNSNLLRIQALALSSAPQKAISVYEDLRNTPDLLPDSIRTNLYISLAKFRIRDYEGSLKILENIDSSRLPRQNQPLYYYTISKVLSRLNLEEKSRIAQLKYEELRLEEVANMRSSQILKNQNKRYEDLEDALDVKDVKYRNHVKYLIVVIAFSLLLVLSILILWRWYYVKLTKKYKEKLSDLRSRERQFNSSISDLTVRLKNQMEGKEVEAVKRVNTISNANEYLRTQFKIINSFCSSYLDMASVDRIVLSNIYVSVQKGIEKLRKDDFYTMLYCHINLLTGNFIAEIEKLSIFTPKEIKLITLLQTGASIHVIALILKMKDSSIFTLRTRMHLKMEKASESIPADIYQNLAATLSTNYKSAQ